MDYPISRKYLFTATLAFWVAALAGCGGGGGKVAGGASPSTPPPPPSGPAPSGNLSEAENRSIALSGQAAPTGSLANDEAFANRLVQELQTRWTPALRDAATVYGTFPYVQGPFDAPRWTTAPLDLPPTEYGTVLASGEQVLARVYRCDFAFDPTYAGSALAAISNVPALDALTAPQRAALSLDAFTTNLLSAVSINRFAARSVFHRPGQITIGDSTISTMERCESRRYGTDLPVKGELSVTTGQVDATLIATPAAGDQIVSNTISLTTILANTAARPLSGTYFAHFSNRSLVSIVRNDLRIFNNLTLDILDTGSIVQQASMFVPVPGANVSGTVAPPTLRVSYDKWKLDSVGDRAIAGIVTVTDGANASATITATGPAYVINIKVGAKVNTYTINP